MNLREKILAADDLKFEDVPIPEWDATVRVRALTSGERDRWEALTYLDKKGGASSAPEDIRAKLIAFSCVDPETNERLFTENDIAALTKKSGVAMNRLWAVASHISRILSSDVEELAKN